MQCVPYVWRFQIFRSWDSQAKAPVSDSRPAASRMGGIAEPLRWLSSPILLLVRIWDSWRHSCFMPWFFRWVSVSRHTTRFFLLHLSTSTRGLMVAVPSPRGHSHLVPAYSIGRAICGGFWFQFPLWCADRESNPWQTDGNHLFYHSGNQTFRSQTAFLFQSLH